MREIVGPRWTFEVTGLFDSGRYQFDALFIFVPLHLGQELYELEGAVHGRGVADRRSRPRQRVRRPADGKTSRRARGANLDRKERCSFSTRSTRR